MYSINTEKFSGNHKCALSIYMCSLVEYTHVTPGCINKQNISLDTLSPKNQNDFFGTLFPLQIRFSYIFEKVLNMLRAFLDSLAFPFLCFFTSTVSSKAQVCITSPHSVFKWMKRTCFSKPLLLPVHMPQLS